MPPSNRNKDVVRNARAAIAEFVDLMIPEFGGMLLATAEGIPKRNKNGEIIYDDDGAPKWIRPPDPATALKLMTDLTEYHLPKLTKSQVDSRTLNLNVGVVDLKSLSKQELIELREKMLIERQPVSLDVIDVEPEPEQELPPWMK